MPSTIAAVTPQAAHYLPTPRERQLLELREQGLSLVAIAGKTNVPESVVVQSFKRLLDLGVAVPESKATSATRTSELAPARVETPSTDRWVWTDDRKGEVRRLYAAGKTASQIAAEIGAPTRSTVIGIIHRLGLKRDMVPAKAAVAREPIVLRASVARPAKMPAPIAKMSVPSVPAEVLRQRLPPTPRRPAPSPSTSSAIIAATGRSAILAMTASGNAARQWHPRHGTVEGSIARGTWRRLVWLRRRRGG